LQVNVPHEQLPEVGAALASALHSSIQHVAGKDPTTCPPTCLVQAACFPGCVQLLAGMYLLPRGMRTGGGSTGPEAVSASTSMSGAPSTSASTSSTTAVAVAGTGSGRWVRPGALAATLLAKAAAALAGTPAGSRSAGVAAAVTVGTGASAAAAANHKAVPAAGGVGSGAISFIALDPPVAPAGCSGPVELFLHADTGAAAAAAAATPTPSAAAGPGRAGPSRALRLLLFNHRGVVMEQEVSQSELQSSSIR
jgi:hypothetical protein